MTNLTTREKAASILSGAKLRQLEDAGLMVVNTPPLPDKRYSVITCDPPWSYRDKAQDGERGAGFKYPVMTLDDIKGLPIRSIAAKDCALFMWATFPMMQEALSVLDAWGFQYRSVAFIWVKTTKHGKLAMGMGNWTRANAEPCLLATRGKPKRVNAGVHSVIMSEHREHSRKPDEVYERIEQLMGDVPRLEMFARQRVGGWDAWGNQVDCSSSSNCDISMPRERNASASSSSTI